LPVVHQPFSLLGDYLFRRDGSRGAIAPPKTYESSFIHHNFVQFVKQHTPHKAILPPTVLTQQSCEVYFVSPTVAKLL